MSSASCSFAPYFCSISLASASSNGNGGTVTLFGLTLSCNSRIAAMMSLICSCPNCSASATVSSLTSIAPASIITMACSDGDHDDVQQARLLLGDRGVGKKLSFDQSDAHRRDRRR